jgi:hypothetical protein
MSERAPHVGTKRPLWDRMYADPAYVALARFIGYGGKPLSEAQQFVQQLEQTYGRDKVIEAGEALSVAEGRAERQTVRLTAEARRLAWQLLGPPPEHTPIDMIAEIMAMGERLKAEPAPTKATNPAPNKRAPRRVKPVPMHTTTPMLQQYQDAKERHPGMLLLFRVGDFYELFGEDAETASKLLGLTLTARDKTMTMAGFPHHSLEIHLQRLLKAGHRVALCEQVEGATPARREVTRVVTPSADAKEPGVQQPRTKRQRKA